MCAARRRLACSRRLSRRRRRASRRARRFARRARMCEPQHTKTTPAAPVRRRVHKVGAHSSSSSSSSSRAERNQAAVQMCEAPSAGPKRPARCTAMVVSAHLPTSQGKSRARRPGPATAQAHLRNSAKLARTKRSLAEIVAQMQQGRPVCARKTLADAQMEQRRAGQAQMGAVAIRLGPENIENIRSQASRSLLARQHEKGKIITKFGKLIIANRSGKGSKFYSLGTSIIGRSSSSSSSIGPQSRSLDNSVRFLHERQLNQQRPSVQRLGPSPPPADLGDQQQQLMTTITTTTARSRDAAGNVGPPHQQRLAKRRLSVTRLVVRSASTQTTRILVSSGQQATRPAPYNTRQRAAAAAAASSSSSSMIVSNRHHHQRHHHHIDPQPARPAAAATMAICERLGSISLQAGAGAAKQVDALNRIKASTYPRWWPWSKWDKSHECQVSDDDQLSLCFHPESSESTAACRAIEPLLRSGQQYYWEVHVEEKCYGTSVMFGLCTRQQRLHVNDYCQLLGEDGHGWSLSHKGVAAHNGQKVQFTEEFAQFQPHTVGLHYDTARGELSYFLNGKSLGVAFRGLNDIEDELYPAVASTAKCTRMRLVSSRCSHMSLLDRSRYALIKSFARDRCALIGYLRAEGAPAHLLEYVNKLTGVRDQCQAAEDGHEEPPARLQLKEDDDEGGPAARTRSSGLHNSHRPQCSSNGGTRQRRSAQHKRASQTTVEQPATGGARRQH